MAMSIFRFVCLTGLIVGRCVLGQAQPNCKPSDPTGYFEGSATSQQAGKLEVSLNLRCDSDRYVGDLNTPVGSYSVKDGHFAVNQLKIAFVAGNDTVTIEASLDGILLHGKFAAGDDAGPLELRRVGDPKEPVISEGVKLTKAQWHEDLQFLVTELPKRHVSAFHAISHEQFEAQVSGLDHRLDALNSDEIYVAMDRIVNLIGDGHTYIKFPDDDANLPIDIERFGNEYRVVATGTNDVKTLGARVLKIDDTPIARAHDIVYSLTPSDETEVLRESRVNGFLTIGTILHGTGITRDRNVARYTLAMEDGSEATVNVQSLDPGQNSKIHWSYAFKDRPLFRQRPDENFWYTYLPDSRTVYCSFRGYQDLRGYSKGLFKLIEQQHPDKLVIDMRLNGGGDYSEGLKYLVDPVRELPGINRKGHLFVLIGPNTFSAAMSNAAHFRYQTKAILVGEQIGEKPNSYQEGREMTLPNSHWTVRYSVKFYKFVENGENLIRPDHEIIPSWNDYRSGSDPVLDWITRYKTNGERQ
jgi:Peptidase family S41